MHGKQIMSCIAVAVMLAAGQAVGDSATRFPDVPLIEGSETRYAVLTIDEAGELPVFILFDGNPEADYNRAYVWMPGHPRFGRPQAMNRGADGTFPPLTIPPGENANVETTWQLTAAIQARGAREERTVTQQDYMTGRTVTQRVAAQAASTYAIFGFRVRYRHAGPYARSLATSSAPLDVMIQGSLPVTPEWDSRGGPLAPWRNLHTGISMTQERLEDDRNHGNLIFGVTAHYAHNTVQFTAIPENARIKLEVFPYLEDPIFAEELPAQRLLAGAFPVKVPYGWYHYAATFACPGLEIRPTTRDHRDVVPFARR